MGVGVSCGEKNTYSRISEEVSLFSLKLLWAKKAKHNSSER